MSSTVLGDYAALRQEGIELLERLATQEWTDFNAHDPGITTLEQLCYALTDLAYRIQHPVPDLLVGPDGDAGRSLHPPEVIFTCDPVTIDDLRRVVLDVPGVRNGWIERVEEPEPHMHYHSGSRELRRLAEPPVSVPVYVRGLYRVLVEAADAVADDPVAIQQRVGRRLHAVRPLCEDFAEIVVLPPEYVQVHASVEIDSSSDPDRALLAILETVSAYVSPPTPFRSLDEILSSGAGIDQAFEGPLLDRGFLTAEALAATERRARLNTSDLIRAISALGPVRAVRRCAVAKGGELESWSLELGRDKAARLDLAGSEISLQKHGIPVHTRKSAVVADFLRRRARTEGGAADSRREPLELPSGRDRHLGRYSSFQRHFPDAYGIGEAGLPASASAQRRAQAKQLQAYLLFFDQLLASHFAQLEGSRELLSFDGVGLRTYFAEPVDEPALGLGEVVIGDRADHRDRVRASIDVEDPGARGRRRARFLDHLLARYGEQLGGGTRTGSTGARESWEDDPAKELDDKRTFLRNYPRVSAGRGTGADYLRPPGERNRSGLEERIQLRLGLAPERAEELVVVEHILLRPTRDDEEQEAPLLTGSALADPYSLAVSLVLPDFPTRFQRPGFRELVEQTAREETPAHLTPYVIWLGTDAWNDFRLAHTRWLERRRRYWAPKFGVRLEEAESA